MLKMLTTGSDKHCIGHEISLKVAAKEVQLVHCKNYADSTFTVGNSWHRSLECFFGICVPLVYLAIYVNVPALDCNYIILAHRDLCRNCNLP